MSDTKTYPLSAIIGEKITDKERIAELADAFNKVCAENADFVAQSVTDENRIAELQDSFEDAVTRAEKAENRLAELEAYLKHAEGHAAELEAEVKALREDAERYRRIAWLISSIFVHGGFKAETHNEAELEKLLRETGNFWESIADFDAALQPERRKGERRKYTRITADRRQAK
jgi:chromosome segregation ATPase